ncbi:glucomannan 4-beta-mannosyltransferase 9-like protein [Tanacetum coccineum]
MLSPSGDHEMRGTLYGPMGNRVLVVRSYSLTNLCIGINTLDRHVVISFSFWHADVCLAIPRQRSLLSLADSRVDRTKLNTDAGTGLFTESDGTLMMLIHLKSPVVEETVAMECPVVNTPDVGPNPPLPTQEANSAGNAPGKPSYATATGKPNGKKVNVRILFTPGGNRIDVVVLGKYGLVRSMFSSSTGLFSFQFSSMDGLDAMLENGPWFIRNNPLILKKWHPDENLLKEDVSTVPVWVKLHGVPVTAFSEDGLSAIATKLGTPLMLDSYTSDMCMQSWGRSSYARVMIELRADVELKDNIVVAMPKITREGLIISNN